MSCCVPEKYRVPSARPSKHACYMFSRARATPPVASRRLLHDFWGAKSRGDTLQNAFGLTFTIFSAWYFLRVVRKRGNAAKKSRVANSLSVSCNELCCNFHCLSTCADNLSIRVFAERRAWKTWSRGTQARGKTHCTAVICWRYHCNRNSIVLYLSCTEHPGILRQSSVPVLSDSTDLKYSAQIVEGLAYLATFIYAANGTGLVALSMQKLLDTAVCVI